MKNKVYIDLKKSKAGRKSTVTSKKIAELGVKVNPVYLSYRKRGNNILVRPGKKANHLYSVVSLTDVKDTKALFYAAAGVRNFMIRNHRKPNDKEYRKIFNRANVTEKNKKYWIEEGKDIKNRKNPYQKEVELVKDTTEATIDIKVGNAPSKRKVGRPRIHTGDNNLIYSQETKTGKMYTTKINLKNGTCIRKSISVNRAGTEESAIKIVRRMRNYIIEHGIKPDRLMVDRWVIQENAARYEQTLNESRTPSKKKEGNAFTRFLGKLATAVSLPK